MKWQLFIGSLFAVWLSSCAKQHIVLPQEDVLYRVESFFAYHPDSALAILDTLQTEMLSAKERAHYCLLKFKVRDAIALYDEESDSLLQVASSYFVGGNDKWFEAETCEALSRIAFKEGKGEQVKLDWLLKACQSMEQCTLVDERFIRYSEKEETAQEWIGGYRNKIQMRLGMCYLDNGYTEEGLRYLKPVYSYFAGKRQKLYWAGSAFMLGNAYLSLKEYDSCRLYFQKGLEAAQQLAQVENEAYYHYSMSMFYLYQYDNKDDESEKQGGRLLEKAIDECHQGLGLYDEATTKYKEGFYSNLSRIYYRLEQYDSCAYYAEKQLDFMSAMDYEIVPNPDNAEIFYRLYKSHEALGHQEEALEFANRYIEMQQSLEKEPKEVANVKNEYDRKLEMMQLQNERMKERYRLYLLLAVAVATLATVLWLTYQYRKNKEIEALRREEAYRKLQSEFEAASQHSLKVMQNRALEIYHQADDNVLGRVMAEFETAYPQAFEKLVASHPELSEVERNIVVLSFLGFRVKEEADMLGLSSNTVTKYRTNIRKKMDYAPVSDLFK